MRVRAAGEQRLGRPGGVSCRERDVRSLRRWRQGNRSSGPRSVDRAREGPAQRTLSAGPEEAPSLLKDISLGAVCSHEGPGWRPPWDTLERESVTGLREHHCLLPTHLGRHWPAT